MPNPKALTNITRPENRTEESDPLDETESMFPERATRVIPIIRMAHSRSAVETKPSS